MDVLLIIDMQNDFINGILGTEDSQKIVSKVAIKIEKYKRKNKLIIFTRDIHNSCEYESSIEWWFGRFNSAPGDNAALQQKKELKMINFCQKYKLNEDQFYGREWINGDLDLSEETFPEGFAPKVKGHLTAEKVKKIPKGTVVHCTGCALFYYCTEVGGHVTIIADKINLSECEVIGAYTRLEAQRRIEVSSLVELHPTVRLTARQKELDACRLETLTSCDSIMAHSLGLDALVNFPENTRLYADGYISLGSAKTLPEGAIIRAGDFIWLGSLDDLPKKVSIQSGTGICLGGKDMPFGSDKDHCRVYSIDSHDGAYYILQVRNNPSSDRLETEYLYRDGDDWMHSLYPPAWAEEGSVKMTLPQMKTAWQLARRFSHHWAVDATEENLTDAAAKANMEDEIFHVHNEYYHDRICPASVEDAYMLAGLDPRVDRCTARNIMPELDDAGVLHHRSGRDPEYHPGRYAWTVYRDGSATLAVHRPGLAVLAVEVASDGALKNSVQGGRYGFRHIIALEKMIACVTTVRLPRSSYTQCAWETDLEDQPKEVLVADLMRLAGIDKSDYWQEQQKGCFVCHNAAVADEE